METIRPDKPEPIAGEKPQGMATILLRFVVLLIVAVVALAIVWSR